MESLEFYSAAAQVIPVLLLAIVVESSFLKGGLIGTMDDEENRLILDEAERRVAQSAGKIEIAVEPDKDFKEAWLRCEGDPGRQLEIAIEAIKSERRRDLERHLRIGSSRWDARIGKLIPWSAITGLGVALGVLFANGAPWWVGIFVWQGIALPGFFLLIHLLDAIGHRLYLARQAAKSRLVDAGILSQDGAPDRDRISRKQRYRYLKEYLSDYGFDETDPA
jgi:hypothetical protein